MPGGAGSSRSRASARICGSSSGGRLRYEATCSPESSRSSGGFAAAEAAASSSPRPWSPRTAKVGDSIAVNGCCLTVVDVGPGWWAADVVDETLARTNLGQLTPGDPRQPRAPGAAERPPRRPSGPGPRRRRRRDRDAGAGPARPHGAADCCATSSRRAPSPSTGCSLTVVEPLADGFSVAIIPHTAGHHPRRQGPRRRRQPRGGHDGQVHRAAARREGLNACRSARIEEAVAAIGRGGIVVVVDDEDRENEGDLIMAAEAATPEKIAFFVRHTSGLICAPITNERADELDLPLMVAQQHRIAAHRLHRHRRLPPRDDDGHLGGRPGGHHPVADRSDDPARRPGPARPHPRAAGPGGRRAQAGRAHRGGRRPGPHGRAVPRRRALRAGHRGRAGDGPTPRARALRGPPRPSAHQHRRPHPLPPPAGEAGAPGGRGPPPHRVGRVPLLRLPERPRPRDPPGLRHGRSPQGADNVLVRVHSECLTGDVFGSLRCDCGAPAAGGHAP